jgi:hypothetical protein
MTTKIINKGKIKLTTYLTNPLVIEPKGSTSPIPKSTTEHDPEPVPSTLKSSLPIFLIFNFGYSAAVLLVSQVATFQEAFSPKFLYKFVSPFMSHIHSILSSLISLP